MKQKNSDQDCKTVEENLPDDNSKDESLSDHQYPRLSEPSDDETETLIDILKGETSSLEIDDTLAKSVNDLPEQDVLSNFSPQSESPSAFSNIGDEQTEQLTDESLPVQDKHRRKRFLIVGIAAGILLLAAFAFLIPTQMKASEISKSLDLGEKYLDEGKYEEAILTFNEVITIDDKQVKAYEGKGEANIGLKNYTEAETQLEAAKAISETDNGSLLFADVYLNTNRKDQGKVLLDGIISNQPSDTRVIIHASRLYGVLNDYATMLDLLEKKITGTKDKDQLKKLFDELINGYVKSGKTEAEIISLLERAATATGDSSYLDKKSSYLVKKPSFGLASGEYQGNQNLEIIKGNAADKVYYTIDSSDPSTSSSEYTAPISLQPGNITVKVIEVNETGVKSPITEGKYIIKQNKLTNEDFVSQLYGYWYSEERKQAYLSFSNTNCSFGSWGKTLYGGAYEIVDTVENGGTIRIPQSSLSDSTSEMSYANIVIEFDFGTPGDNKMSWHIDNGDWSHYTAVEYLGNNQYRMPTSFNTYTSGNIITLN